MSEDEQKNKEEGKRMSRRGSNKRRDMEETDAMLDTGCHSTICEQSYFLRKASKLKVPKKAHCDQRSLPDPGFRINPD